MAIAHSSFRPSFGFLSRRRRLFFFDFCVFLPFSCRVSGLFCRTRYGEAREHASHRERTRRSRGWCRGWGASDRGGDACGTSCGGAWRPWWTCGPCWDRRQWIWWCCSLVLVREVLSVFYVLCVKQLIKNKSLFINFPILGSFFYPFFPLYVLAFFHIWEKGNEERKIKRYWNIVQLRHSLRNEIIFLRNEKIARENNLKPNPNSTQHTETIFNKKAD